MSDDSRTLDSEIIQSAYADKVKEAFKVFAENLGMGQNQQNSLERFARTLELTRKARDMALEAASGAWVLEEPGPLESPATAAAAATAGMENLSAEHRALIEQALAGTTGHRSIR